MVNQDKKEFIVNNHLTLKLEESKTKILVDNEEFLICKTAILNIPKNKTSDIESIDNLIEISSIIEEEDLGEYKISPLMEFWAHSSNLYVWAENDYNSDLLDSRLSFPLLKRLAEVGDITAKRVFKEEIARRYTHGSYHTQSYLEFEEFLDFLTIE